MKKIVQSFSFTISALDVAKADIFCSQKCLLGTALRRRGYDVASVGVYGTTLRFVRGKQERYIRYNFDRLYDFEALKYPKALGKPTKRSIGITVRAKKMK